MMSRTGSARRILGDLKKSVSWVDSCLTRRRLTFAYSRRPWAGVARDWGGGRWKSQNRKNVYLSPYVKGYKKCHTWTKKSLRVFRVSKFLYSVYTSYIYIPTSWTFCVPVWICPFHVFISGYGTIISC